MKIKCYGASFYAGQVDRIEAGFVALGHELVEDISKADLVYSNDEGGYTKVLSHKERGDVKGKIIFNVLDIPAHNLDTYDLSALDRKLAQADAVTVISQFVQGQLIQYLKRGSSVVYCPIKNITYNPAPRSDRYARFLSVGRRSDPNKNHRLGVQALQLLGINYGQLALVGGEFSNWGEYLGVLKDSQLDQAYNSVDFVFALGKCEGLGLPLIEGMAAGVIPIACQHLTTLTELLPPDLFPEYNDVHPTSISISRFVARYLGDNHEMLLMKARLHSHYLKVWKDRVSPVGVAQAILNVYEGIKP